MAKIPLVNLEAQHRPIREEMLQALTRCLDSGSYILGEEVERLEQEIADLCGASFGVGVSSGTDAVLVSLMALGVGAGDEVVTTAYSFFATAGGVSRLGARPIFVDIDDTYNIDPAKIEAVITERTKAVLPVHLYGQCADMEPILATARQHGIPVIEDAAQAIGASYCDGRKAGSMGAVACLSFYPTKNLAAIGEAGMVVTSDESHAETLKRLRNHGADRTYFHQVVSGNFRMDAAQAAVLRVKLRHLDDWAAGRRARARFYDELFQESGLVDDGSVEPPRAVRDHVYHQYVIRFPSGARDRVREHLATQGIGSGIYYPLPLPMQPCFRGLGHAPGDFPNAESASRDTLAIPVYPELTEEEQRTVVEVIRSAL